jgi:hypothetical protein
VTLLVTILTGDGMAAVSCHIHPPGSTVANPQNLVGPFSSIEACETERVKRFGASGRCHCAADFAPRWLPPARPQHPGESPFG